METISFLIEKWAWYWNITINLFNFLLLAFMSFIHLNSGKKYKVLSVF